MSSFRQSRLFHHFHKPSTESVQSPDSSRLSVPVLELPKNETHAPEGTDRVSPLPSPGTPGESSIRSKRSSFFFAGNGSALSLLSSTKSSSPPATVISEEPGEQHDTQSENKPHDDPTAPPAWVIGHRERAAYDLEDLLNGRQVAELWDEHGDCLVHLFPQESDKSASFKVKSSIFESSRQLKGLAETACIRDSYDHQNSETNLYFPVDRIGTPDGRPHTGNPQSSPDVGTLIAVRNLFAFLMGRSIVATKACSSVFDIFIKMSQLLKAYEFSNVDGSSFGQLVSLNFNAYIDEFTLDDVRNSTEKTIEGIVLGEHMKSVKLYNEAFTHAVGKYDEIQQAANPRYRLISPITVNRLGRAALNLDKTAAMMKQTLEGLEFPSVFSGILQSRDTRKNLDPEKCKESFHSTRKFYIKFYKHKYKKWLPKLATKYNADLNRPFLQVLYQDLSDVYDLLVDRTKLTISTSDEESSDDQDSMEKLLRRIFSEYNGSSPPVKPAIPFDIPLIPSMDEKIASKKLKDDDIAKALEDSYNKDVTPDEFVDAFKAMERKQAHGSHNLRQLIDLRLGQWIFVYALIQVLPLLVVDAPGLQHTKDVEYFLSEAPRSGVPWARDEARSASPPPLGVPSVKAAAAVSLPADVWGPGVEGIYYRSHCWVMAEKWYAANNPTASAPLRQPPPPTRTSTNSSIGSFVRPPTRNSTPSSTRSGPRPPIRTDTGSSTYSIPARVGSRVASLASSSDGSPTSSSASLSVPVRPTARARPVSVYDPTKTFDTIFGAQDGNQKD